MTHTTPNIVTIYIIVISWLCIDFTEEKWGRGSLEATLERFFDIQAKFFPKLYGLRGLCQTCKMHRMSSKIYVSEQALRAFFVKLQTLWTYQFFFSPNTAYLPTHIASGRYLLNCPYCKCLCSKSVANIRIHSEFLWICWIHVRNKSPWELRSTTPIAWYISSRGGEIVWFFFSHFSGFLYATYFIQILEPLHVSIYTWHYTYTV